MKKRETKRVIPGCVIYRLTKYLTHVRGLRLSGQRRCFSKDIAESLGLTSSTVRQDLSYLDFSRATNRGYEVKRLEAALYRGLGIGHVTNVVVVGAGNLGRALALHREFEDDGFVIRAIFDNNVSVIGKKIGRLKVLNINSLCAAAKKVQADMGMIAVPADSAQTAADQLVGAGIRGIINFSPCHIKVRESIVVVDVGIINSMFELQYLLKQGSRKTRI